MDFGLELKSTCSQRAKIKSITNKSPAQIAGLMINDKIKSLMEHLYQIPLIIIFHLLALIRMIKSI